MTDNTPAGRIRAALEDIRRDYDDTLEPARRAAGSHVSMSLINPPLPVPASVLDARAKAHERLGYWAWWVITTRKLHRLAAADPPSLCAFLLIHADFLAAHKWAGHAITELEHSAVALAAIVAQNAPHRFIVARCPVEDCAGLLRVTLRRDDDALPSEIRCTLDSEHTWAPSQWAYMARVVS